jgi:hypothetical protein
VVALQYGASPPAESASKLESARAEVERLSAGSSRGLLSATPSRLRSLASSAADAMAAVERRRARVGERPELDAAADAAVSDAFCTYRSACSARESVVRDRQRLLALGNGAGLASFVLAGGLLSAGVQVMSAPVAFFMVGAAVGPLTSAAIALNRNSLAVRGVGTARSQWAAALDRAGYTTMGELRARRLAVAGWERREAEAQAAEAAAKSELRAWQLVAGPGVAPSDVEAVIARMQRLRAAQLRLLRLMLEARLQVAPAVAVAASAVPDAVEAGWFGAALQRLRGRKLHFS